MKKCLLVPDSFKGTLTSIEVCDIMREVILRREPHCEVRAFPIADGGEGTVDCFLRALGGEGQNAGRGGGGEEEEGQNAGHAGGGVEGQNAGHAGGGKVRVRVHGPFMEEIDSFYGRIGDMAVIEMAAAAGLPQAGARSNPRITTTYGVGELMRDAVLKGCKKILLGLGGSCTNDGGCGMAAALGVRFYRAPDELFLPVGETLGEIWQIDLHEAKTLLCGVELIAMYDTEVPVFGPDGIANVYCKQKGASPADLPFLDENLRAYSETIQSLFKTDITVIPGAGAAGAMGAGFATLLGGTLKKGIDVVLDAIRFEEEVKGCDCVFTGEGRFDSQSLTGKVISGIAARTKTAGIPLIIVAGAAEESAAESLKGSIFRVYETGRGRTSFEEISLHAREDLAAAMDRVLSDLL